MSILYREIAQLSKAGVPTSGVNEVQTLELTGNPTSGTFTITFGAAESDPIAYNATAAQVQAALEALSTIGPGNVSCSGGPLPAEVSIEYVQAFGGLNKAEITADGAGIQGAAPGISIATTTQGVAGVAQIETATVVGTIDVAGEGDAAVIVTASGLAGSPVTYNVAVANLDTASAVGGKIRTALGLESAITDRFTVSGSGADVVLTKILKQANDASLNISIDNGTCTGLTAAPTSVNTTAGVAPVNEVQTVTLTGAPTGGTFDITFDGETAAAIAYDATSTAFKSALEALSNVGVGQIQATGGPFPATITVTFQGTLAATNVAQMTGDAANLTEPGVSVGTATAGVRGDFRGSIPGQIVLDTTNHILYQNQGSRPTPQWVEIDAV